MELHNNKNILDLFIYDLSKFFIDEDYEQISCEEIQGLFMIEYEKTLPWTELNIFDKLRFRVFNDKQNIIGSNHINATLLNDGIILTNLEVKNVVNKLHEIYGKDDNNKREWSQEDEIDYIENIFCRVWTLGDGIDVYSITLTISPQKQLMLSILFFTNLLKQTNKL
ncbi:MAG: hypothetical protein IMY72_01285 [Bacteroidetes bacterium]|nr:hypothetical protein [Bacteroidota bacterium]